MSEAMTPPPPHPSRLVCLNVVDGGNFTVICCVAVAWLAGFSCVPCWSCLNTAGSKFSVSNDNETSSTNNMGETLKAKLHSI
jgi:hypothetical protein